MFLPVDNTYHHIIISVVPFKIYFSIDNIQSQFYQNIHYYDDEEIPLFANYAVYMSHPHSDYVNANVSNICTTSSMDTIFSHVNCGDTITGRLLSASDIQYYNFHLTKDSAVLFDGCESFYQTELHLYGTNFVLIKSAFWSSNCASSWRPQLEVLSLPAGEYIFEINGRGWSFGEWKISVYCRDSQITKNIQCGDVLTGELLSPYDINHYYFNLSTYSEVSFNACESTFNTHLYLLQDNLTEFHSNDDSSCGSQSQIYLPKLKHGQYILKISGHGADYYHSYGRWHVSVTCNHCQYSNCSLSSYKLMKNTNHEPWQTPNEFYLTNSTLVRGTVATVITDNDIRSVFNILLEENVDINHNITIYIGMYNNGSTWKWNDGTPCDYTPSGDCVDDTHWGHDQPGKSNYGVLKGTCLKLVYPKMFIFEIDAVDDQCDYTLLNAPLPHSCTNKLKCWKKTGVRYNFWDYYWWADCECDRLFINKPLRTIFWNHKLYVIGMTSIHYASIDGLFNESKWNYVYYKDAWNYWITSWGQDYSSYKESLYFYTNNNSNPSYLLHINLETWDLKRIRIPLSFSVTVRWAMYHMFSSGSFSSAPGRTMVCVVATQNDVYIFTVGQVLIYNIASGIWSSALYEIDVITFCTASNDGGHIYTFGFLFGTLNKFDTITNTYVATNAENICTTRLTMAVTARNDKIYLPGCSLNVWETLVFDIKSEQFELSTVDIDYPIEENMYEYERSQLVSIDDNILLLIHPTFGDTKSIDDYYGWWGYELSVENVEATSIAFYYTITDLICINFQDTKILKNSSIWPSDGFNIKYYVNDFSKTKEEDYGFISSVAGTIVVADQMYCDFMYEFVRVCKQKLVG
eukprot:361568_1